MKIRGTFHGDQRTERLLHSALEGIRADIAMSPLVKSIQAVVLGGSYGRGEGGAASDGSLCNDLDFFVVVPYFSPRRKIATLFEEIGNKWSIKLNIEVDFAYPRTLDEFEHKSSTLMIRDLLAGHQIVFGQKDCFSAITRCPWEELPFSEGLRLLLNRGTGILLAEQRHNSGTDDPNDQEFIERNLHKAALGCGDALLIAQHALCASGTERRMKLNELALPEKLCVAYSEALEYKYCPTQDDVENLATWLKFSKELFSETVKTFFTLTAEPLLVNSRAHYARANFKDYRTSLSKRLRNLVLNIFYFRKLPYPLLSTVHPRMKIFAMLIHALQDPSNNGLRERYLQLWKRFN